MGTIDSVDEVMELIVVFFVIRMYFPQEFGELVVFVWELLKEWESGEYFEDKNLKPIGWIGKQVYILVIHIHSLFQLLFQI